MINLQLKFPEGFFEEEIRDGFLVTKERKEIWAVELDLLSELLRVCYKYNITIFVDGGTSIGAMRHQGFIPWDDDIDMKMLRSEYKRLCDVAQEEFKPPYFFQTEFTDPGSMRGHAQLRNSETTGILKSEYKRNCTFNQGIFIDIFPLDYVPEDTKKRNTFIKTILKKRKLARGYARISTRYNTRSKSFEGVITSFLHKCIGKRTKHNPFYYEYERYMQKYDEHPSEYVGNLFLANIPEKYIWETKWFSEVLIVPFEFLQVPVPKFYDKVLTRQYGDWKTPIMGPSIHGEVIFDTNKSYTSYFE